MRVTEAPRSRGGEGEALGRRQYLAVLGTSSVVATAGCLGNVFGGSGEVVLEEQSDARDSEHLPYPSYGEPFPEIELPDPIAETTVSTADQALEGETLVVTAFYAFCPAECLLLIRALSSVQAMLLADGADGVTFLAITFDPERDTASAYQ